MRRPLLDYLLPLLAPRLPIATGNVTSGLLIIDKFKLNSLLLLGSITRQAH